ncbi:MAG TPA: hypothetical protein DDW52_14900 [Planctomycetaceae bacterium]|nr:hypothetical protein [Planctomycetaceae bacterium]
MSQPQGSAACPECNLVLRFAVGNSPKVALKCPACGLLFETNVEKTVGDPAGQSDTTRTAASKPVFKAKIVSTPSSLAASPAEPEILEPEIHQPEIIEPEIVSEGAALEATAAGTAEPFEQIPLLPKPRLSKPPSAKPEKRKRDTGEGAMPQAVGLAGANGGSSKPATGKRAVKLGLAAMAAAVMLAIGGTGAFLLFRGGSEDGEHAGIAIAEKLTNNLAEYVAILETVSDGDSRGKAAKELQELSPQFDTLAMQALACPMTEDSSVAQEIQQLLNDASPLQAKLLAESRRINENFALDDELYTVDARLKSAVNAIDKHLRYSVVELTPAESNVQRTCASIIASKRRINNTLAATGTTDVVRTVEKLQKISDELNQLADNHSKSGRRISIMAHDYEEANEAADVMREWAVTHIREEFSKEYELTYTLDEVQRTATRVAKALASGVDKLVSTTKQRVDARLLAMDITPRSRVQDFGGTGGSPSAIVAVDASNSPSRTPTYRPNQSLASKPADQNRARSASSSSSSSSPQKRWQSGKSASETTASTSHSSDPKNALVGANTVDGTSIGSRTDNASLSDSRYSNESQPTSKYRGEGCVQVKLIGREYEEVQQEMRTLVSSLGVSRLDIAGSENRVTLSFPYTGSLYRVARKIDFGEVVVCDSQSRTLFVRATQ